MKNASFANYQKRKQDIKDEILTNRLKQKFGIPDVITLFETSSIDSSPINLDLKPFGNGLGLMVFAAIGSCSMPSQIEGAGFPRA